MIILRLCIIIELNRITAQLGTTATLMRYRYWIQYHEKTNLLPVKNFIHFNFKESRCEIY